MSGESTGKDHVGEPWVPVDNEMRIRGAGVEADGVPYRRRLDGGETLSKKCRQRQGVVGELATVDLTRIVNRFAAGMFGRFQRLPVERWKTIKLLAAEFEKERRPGLGD